MVVFRNSCGSTYIRDALRDSWCNDAVRGLSGYRTDDPGFGCGPEIVPRCSFRNFSNRPTCKISVCDEKSCKQNPAGLVYRLFGPCWVFPQASLSPEEEVKPQKSSRKRINYFYYDSSNFINFTDTDSVLAASEQ